MPGLRFHAIAHKPTVVLDMTSLTVDEFHQLVPVVEVAFQAYLVEWRLDGKPRTTRKPTIYKNCPLPTPEDRLLFILVYLKTNPLQVAHGLMFGLPQGKANQWIHVLLPRVQAALRQSGDAPRRSLDALASEFTVPAAADLAALAPPFCHDGTERRIPRPQNGAEQKSHYSGKKKCHTVKNLLLINVPLRILFLRATTAGSVHDKRLADHTPYPLPVGSPLLQDRGFLGFKLVDVDTQPPQKKPRGGTLTPAQHASNEHLARRRVRIEHVNSSVKRCRIVQDTIRRFKRGVRDRVIEICCALHNFRVRLTPWKPMT